MNILLPLQIALLEKTIAPWYMDPVDPEITLSWVCPLTVSKPTVRQREGKPRSPWGSYGQLKWEG